MNNFFSICIACYEMREMGIEYLTNIIDSCKRQTFKDFEIVISDHSVDDAVASVFESTKNDINIKYHRNKDNIGSSSSNFNNSIRNSTGKYIKILCQDDFLMDSKHLEKVKRHIDLGKKWVISGSTIIDKKRKIMNINITPSYNERIIFGINTIGAPSVVCFENNNNFFDENLIWLMDCDMYYRLFNKYGQPGIISTPDIAVRDWDGSVTRTVVDGNIRTIEENMIIDKFKLNEVKNKQNDT